MRKLFFYLALYFSILLIVTDFLNAQISEIWTKDGGDYETFIGSANMDNDPQEEIVYCDGYGAWLDDILIFDGLSGKIDWSSGGSYEEIKIAGHSSGDNYGLSSPFLNLGNGLKALTFHAEVNSNDMIVVVGLIGGSGAIEKQEIISPDVNKLSQNYPNPFNPDTKINYTVQQPSMVEIKIYNSLGQLVKAFVNEYKPMGEYEIVWDGKDDNGITVSSGAYFYQLKVGDFISSKKMLLLK